MTNQLVGPAWKHPVYRVWAGMCTRCHNPNFDGFKNYGARGIYVCDEWRFSAHSFVIWAIASGWSPGLELDRINNDGPYSPDNCRFVTRGVNMSNRRNTLRLPDGSLLLDAVTKAGVNYQTVLTRIKSGIAPDDAISMTPLKSPRPSYRGMSFFEACRVAGINYKTVEGRLRRGWLISDALLIASGSKRPSRSKKVGSE